MNKYVIKNCPATYQNFEDKFVCTSRIKQKGFPFYCQDCTDCIIKQIVELCKEPFNNFDLDDTRIQDKKFYAHLLLMPILKLLEIEEVE